jgi:CMP-N,N'-diacetyllegionaminic acid synthase
MPEILAIIPARSGSKRVPGKNLRQIHGKHLFQFALEAALDSKIISEIVLSTDSQEILQKAKMYGNRIHIVQRPAAISTDDSPAIEYVLHVLDYMKSLHRKDFDIIAIVQPSSPLTTGRDIDNTIQIMLDYHTECAASIREIPHDLHPSKHLFLHEHTLNPLYDVSKAPNFNETNQKVYVRNGSVYVSSIDLIKKGKILSENCAAYIMPASRSVDINDELDLLFAEFLMQRNYL